MKNLKITLKLLILCGQPLAVIALLSLLTFLSVRSNLISIWRVQAASTVVYAISNDFLRPINTLREVSLSLVMAPSDVIRQQIAVDFDPTAAKVDEAFVQWQSNIGPEEQKQYEILQQEWRQYRQLAQITRHEISSGFREAAFINANGAERQQFRALNNHIVEWQARALERGAGIFASVTTSAKNMLLLVTLIGCVSIIATTVLSVWISKGISGALGSLARATDRLARGDTSTSIPEVGRGDEIGHLADAMQIFKENLVELHVAAQIYRVSSEGMMVTDQNNRVLAVNGAFSNVTGYSQEEVAGRDPGFLKSGRQDEEFYKAMWASLREGGFWQGEIWNRRKNGEVFPEWLTINVIYDNENKVQRYVALFSDMTKKKESEEIIWKQANFDSLTDLPNRRMFRDQMEREIKKADRANLPLALMFIDLDRFKEVNDTLGHHYGDELLVEAAQRILACVRETDPVARLGGDEFTVALTQLHDVRRVDEIANKIVKMLARRFHLRGETVYVSASIGITLYPEDGGNYDELMKNADQAMYAAKALGRNRYHFFTKSIQDEAQRRVHMINDLREAIAVGQFLLYFQPILDAKTGHICKAEALLRWQHPVRGIVSPAEFIPLAEETGLIIEIGEWVMREVVACLKKWGDLCPEGFQVSINKSPVQFMNSREGEDILIALCDDAGVSHSSVIVEITEGLLLGVEPYIINQIMKYRDCGIQVAIDDFGTGYSSLSYLKKFHIDYLKIDQSFVSNLENDINNQALSEAIIAMAHKLGLKVVAEGVETDHQKDILVAAGCDFIQGYLVSHPVPSEQFQALLRSDRLD